MSYSTFIVGDVLADSAYVTEPDDSMPDLLHAVLDEFDRLTGRTEHHAFTQADWDRVRARLEGSPR